MTRDAPGEAKPPSPLATVVVGALCVIVGGVFWLLCERSSGNGDSDFFDSSLWWFGFVILPGFALVASGAQPRYPRQWAILLVLPQALATVLLGTVFHDPDDGTSLWMAGLVFVGLQGVVSLGGAKLGSAPDTAAMTVGTKALLGRDYEAPSALRTGVTSRSSGGAMAAPFMPSAIRARARPRQCTQCPLERSARYWCPKPGLSSSAT